VRDLGDCFFGERILSENEIFVWNFTEELGQNFGGVSRKTLREPQNSVLAVGGEVVGKIVGEEDWTRKIRGLGGEAGEEFFLASVLNEFFVAFLDAGVAVDFFEFLLGDELADGLEIQARWCEIRGSESLDSDSRSREEFAGTSNF